MIFSSRSEREIVSARHTIGVRVPVRADRFERRGSMTPSSTMEHNNESTARTREEPIHVKGGGNSRTEHCEDCLDDTRVVECLLDPRGLKILSESRSPGPTASEC